jgi:hypothetical protein
VSNKKEEYSEIEKIKFILKEVIKKREKMGKKSSAKKAKKKSESLEKNKEIPIQDINLKELSKFEKIREFRNLENISITYGDNEKDKFKDFQEIYSLIDKEIEIQSKKWIYSEKDEIYYILPYKFLTTERIEGTIYYHYKDNQKKLEEISNRLKEREIYFEFPEEENMELLENIAFIGRGDWLCTNDFDNKLSYYNPESFEYDVSYGDNLLGIYKLDNFLKSLEDRNKKLNFKNNDLINFYSILEENEIDINKEYNFDELLDIIDIINDEKIREAFKLVENGEIEIKNFLKECEVSLLENDSLRDFEVILNYNLLDPSIITKEYEKKFNKLVEAYRTYKDYIACVYNEDDKKVRIFFDRSKIIESIKSGEKVFNNIEITYLENLSGIQKEIIYLDKNVYYYQNGEIEEIYNTNSGINYSIYHFVNKDIEERTYQMVS